MAHFIFSEQCFKQYFHDFDFFDVDCFKATLSKCLGLGVIAGSVLVKVPQILKIFHAKSAKGISVGSVLLDLFAITAMFAYSYANKFPFSAWGDSVFMGIQTLIINFLVVYYNNGLAKATTFLTFYVVMIAMILSSLVPMTILWTAQASNIPVVLAAKLLQAYSNYSNGNTGQLSAVTVLLLLFGSLARIFTSIQETGDATMVLIYIVATSANTLIAAQMLYYWNAAEDKIAKKNK